jgi:Flp pilus assembly protein TadB
VTAAILGGLLVGLGIWLAWTGWRATPEPLAVVLGRIGQQPTTVSKEIPADIERDVRLGSFLLRHVPPLQRAVDKLRSDLRIVDRTPEEQAARVGSYVLLSLFLGPWVGLVALIFGRHLPLLVPVLGSFAGAAWGAFAPFRSLRQEAAARRRAFVHALSAWCDVVVMTLAAGRGVEQAMETAASIGSGWAFAEIRGALRAGYVRGEPPWESLEQLGIDLAIPDLTELGSTIAMAGEEGAAIRTTVAAKARTVRERMTSDSEATAAAATERMSLPSVLMVMGFLIFIGFPAVLTLFDLNG